MESSSFIELNQKALKLNIEFIREQMGPSVIITSMVKGNAYGHGIEEMVPIIESAGINSFAAFSIAEAKRIKKVLKESKTLIITGYIPDTAFDWVVENEIEFFVFNIYRLEKAIEAARKLNKKAIIHIDLETGMNRTGLNFCDLKKAVSIIKSNQDQIRLRGICTHFAGAESISNYVRIQNQFKLYNEYLAYLQSVDISPEIRHTACSAAAMTYPETRLDMVRIGIMQYGFWPSKETFIHYVHDKKDKSDPLKRVLKWKSEVLDVKTVKQGEFVSYGNYYQAYKDMKIAIIPVGYCDGYSRSLSNQGRVLVNGERISVIGLVNMNMIIANVSKLSKIKIGDEVVIIGKQGKHQLSVASFSELSKQVNYELLTRLPKDICRIKT
jgi:alanine racemase